jgi:hypothetical protein
MTDFIVKKLPYDLNSHASLAFIGKYLKRINVNALIALGFPTARFLKATLPCCAWARAISMPSRAFGTTPSSSARWV